MTSDNSEDRQTIRILGETIPVKSTEQTDEQREALKLVRDQIKSMRRQSSGASRLQIALLTSLNIAGHLVQLQRSDQVESMSSDQRDRLESLHRKLLSLMEEREP